MIVYKGATRSSPRPTAAPRSPRRLALAGHGGTGDVLAGIIAAMRASGMAAFEAACAGVWLHGRAGGAGRPGLIADDLLDHLPAAIAECL